MKHKIIITYSDTCDKSVKQAMGCFRLLIKILSYDNLRYVFRKRRSGAITEIEFVESK